MKVKAVMKTEVRTVQGATPCREAFEVMKKGGFRHLPVMEGERLLGIISDRDLRLVMTVAGDIEEKEGLGPEAIPESMTVTQIMTGHPAILMPETDLRLALSLMTKHKIGALPVLDKGKLVGIVTETDMLRLLLRILESQGR